MLVLTRKSGQKLRIGNRIVITVLDCSSGQIKIGVEAPKEIPIYREEVYSRIQEKNRSSLVTDTLSPGLLSRLLKGMK